MVDINLLNVHINAIQNDVSYCSGGGGLLKREAPLKIDCALQKKSSI